MYRDISNQKKSRIRKGWVLVFGGLTVLCVLLSLLLSERKVLAASSGPSFVEFESGQVRPLAMSLDRNELFAVNTPDGMLEVFRITPQKLVLKARVPVGMEPVAVAVRNESE